MSETPGYTWSSKVYRLTFEDPDLAGLIVRVRSVPLGNLIGLVHLADVAERMLQAGGVGADDLARVADLFTGFGDALLEWNLRDEVTKEPVPPTRAGVLAQDPQLIVPVCVAWIQAVVGVRRPLDKPSSAGVPLAEESIPMEVPLTSPSS